MKKALILVGILSGTIAAHAGFKAFVPVEIGWYDSSSGYARGSLGDARESSSKDELIGCVHHATSWDNRYVTCIAVTAKNESAACFTTDPNVMAALDTLQGDSHLWFGWDSNGRCGVIEVFNASQFRPKTP